jgi:hypothetical protein
VDRESCLIVCFYCLGCVDVDRSPFIYDEIKRAQENLVLANDLHLLYLVTTPDMIRDITPNWMTYLEQVSLSTGELNTYTFLLVRAKKIAKWKTGFPLCPPCIIVVPEMTQKVHQMFIVLRFQVSILPNKKRVNLLECRKDILLEKYHVMDQRRWVEIITMQYYVGLTNTWT